MSEPPAELWVIVDRDGRPTNCTEILDWATHEVRVRNAMPAWSGDAPHVVYRYVLASEESPEP